MCDPDTTGGAWLAKLDLVESGKKLKVVEQPRPGKCGTACRTAARACVEALADHDTDLAEAIFAQRSDPAASGRAALEQLLCRDLGDACSQPPPPLPASRPPGPAFEEMSEQEAEMEKLMRSMSGIPGMPGAPCALAFTNCIAASFVLFRATVAEGACRGRRHEHVLPG